MNPRRTLRQTVRVNQIKKSPHYHLFCVSVVVFLKSETFPTNWLRRHFPDSGGVKHALPLPSDIRVILDFKLRVSLLNDSFSGSFIIFFPSRLSPAVSHFFHCRAAALTAIHVAAADWLCRIKPLFVPPSVSLLPLVYCLPLTAFAFFYVSLSLVRVKSQRRRDVLFFQPRLATSIPPSLRC